MKKLIMLIALMFSFCFVAAQDFVFETSVDLNADGIEEEIKLDLVPKTYGSFVLTIAGIKVQGELDEVIDGFKIIDINTNDAYKEVAVHTPGPSHDDIYLIYWFDGKNIIKMAELSRWPTFLGNGIVYVDGWMDFWTIRNKYQLDNTTRRLKHVPQFAYYVGKTVKVKNSFTIYKNQDLTEKVALLAQDSSIELLLCNEELKENYGDNVYLIKSGSGLVGWASSGEIYKNSTGFMFAD